MGVVLRQPLDRLSAILHAVSKIYKAAILHISHTKDAFNSSVVKILVFHTYVECLNMKGLMLNHVNNISSFIVKECF